MSQLYFDMSGNKASIHVKYGSETVTFSSLYYITEAIHDLFKPFCDEEGIKMGKLGMPLRLAVCGTAKTPSVDAVLALIGKEEVLKRIRS